MMIRLQKYEKKMITPNDFLFILNFSFVDLICGYKHVIVCVSFSVHNSSMYGRKCYLCSRIY